MHAYETALSPIAHMTISVVRVPIHFTREGRLDLGGRAQSQMHGVNFDVVCCHRNFSNLPREKAMPGEAENGLTNGGFGPLKSFHPWAGLGGGQAGSSAPYPAR